MFLSSHRNTHGSLGELKKAVETRTLAYWLVFLQHFSFSQTSTHVCYSIETWYKFSHSNQCTAELFPYTKIDINSLCC